ncbi:MAG: hypothetical protein PCFJNLEI_00869 [Verrucomicrobiae bacterium]|nr:hypothetical protein [Verrucomicrobiae bacterium]
MSKRIDELDKNFAPIEVTGDVSWYDIRDLEVEGRGWRDTENFYDRLPARAKGTVREPVWQLSQHAAGLCVRFVTDAPAISARWKLRNANLAMPHMPASGMSGLDLYAKVNGQWVWAGVGIPGGQESKAVLAQNLVPELREYLLYLPLYNGVESVAIGIAPTAQLARPAKRPLGFVIYGTSIVQGGCACRAGMGYPEILARALDCHSINLGFSGNGPMEIEVVRLLAELDPAVFILDCLPNMGASQVSERTEPAVQTLRTARPATPIVLVENIIYQRAPVQIAGTAGHEAKNIELKKVWQRLRKARVPGLFYVPAGKLLGTDNLGTVDGTHPTDVGFLRLAKALAPVVRRAFQSRRTVTH